MVAICAVKRIGYSNPLAILIMSTEEKQEGGKEEGIEAGRLRESYVFAIPSMVPQSLFYCFLTSLDIGSGIFNLSLKASPHGFGISMMVKSPLHNLCFQKCLPSSEEHPEKCIANYRDQKLGSGLNNRLDISGMLLCLAMFSV